MNPNRSLIKGVICGVRVEEIKDSLMRELRYLDKLIDELAEERKWKKSYVNESPYIKITDLLRKHGGKTGEELKAEGK